MLLPLASWGLSVEGLTVGYCLTFRNALSKRALGLLIAVSKGILLLLSRLCCVDGVAGGLAGFSLPYGYLVLMWTFLPMKFVRIYHKKKKEITKNCFLMAMIR